MPSSQLMLYWNLREARVTSCITQLTSEEKYTRRSGSISYLNSPKKFHSVEHSFSVRKRPYDARRQTITSTSLTLSLCFLAQFKRSYLHTQKFGVIFNCSGLAKWNVFIHKNVQSENEKYVIWLQTRCDIHIKPIRTINSTMHRKEENSHPPRKKVRSIYRIVKMKVA